MKNNNLPSPVGSSIQVIPTKVSDRLMGTHSVKVKIAAPDVSTTTTTTIGLAKRLLLAQVERDEKVFSREDVVISHAVAHFQVLNRRAVNRCNSVERISLLHFDGCLEREQREGGGEGKKVRIKGSNKNLF